MQNMLEKLIGESKALERAIAGEDLNAQDGIELMAVSYTHLTLPTTPYV